MTVELLLKDTTAYKILRGDRCTNKLSHAYILHFQDPKNLKSALIMFALEFFGADKNSNLGQRILNGSYSDFRFYPAEDKKFAADSAAEIIEDSALRPVEGSKKLYVICGFEQASALVQNKLLKTLEEPLEGIYFLLGACSLAPVLDTVKSRVKLLEIPPFSQQQIYEALERKGHKEINAPASASANGVLGVAENMAEGGWFKELTAAAEEICGTVTVENAGEISAKYGDIKYKQELLCEMQRLYFTALTGGTGAAKNLQKSTLVFALEKINAAIADLKFNANFSWLLYDFILCVAGFEQRARKAQDGN